jgi:hypothetical protein
MLQPNHTICLEEIAATEVYKNGCRAKEPLIRKFLVSLYKGNEKIFVHPLDSNKEGHCDIRLKSSSPDVNHIDGRGRPRFQNYGLNRIAIYDRLRTLDVFGENFDRRKNPKFNNIPRSNDRKDWNNYFAPALEVLENEPIPNEAVDLCCHLTVDIAMALRFFITHELEVPHFILRDIRSALNVTSKRGKTAGALVQKHHCQDALDNLVSHNLYHPTTGSIRIAAILIRRIFGYSGSESGIEKSIRERHSELAEKQVA